MIRAEVIRKRLNKLDEYLSILQSLQSYKCVNDLGNHIIADEKLGTINWYSDIPEILREKGYIDPGLREKWLQMIGFRNILVHEYLEIDRRIVFDILQNHLADLEELRAVFARFL